MDTAALLVVRQQVSFVGIAILEAFPAVIAPPMHSGETEAHICWVAVRVAAPLDRLAAKGEEPTRSVAFAGCGIFGGRAACACDEAAQRGDRGGDAADACLNVGAEDCVGDPDWIVSA